MKELIRKKTAVGVPARREEVIEILNEAFSRDIIELDEFEARIDQAEQARYIEDLETIIKDIPGDLQQAGQQEMSPVLKSRNKNISSVMSTKKIPGQWLSSGAGNIKSIMSDITLDFRHLELPPGITIIKLKSVMSHCLIIVPPGLRVENHCREVMSSVLEDDLLLRVKSNKAAVIYLEGFLVMSSLNIKVK